MRSFGYDFVTLLLQADGGRADDDLIASAENGWLPNAQQRSVCAAEVLDQQQSVGPEDASVLAREVAVTIDDQIAVLPFADGQFTGNRNDVRSLVPPDEAQLKACIDYTGLIVLPTSIGRSRCRLL